MELYSIGIGFCLGVLAASFSNKAHSLVVKAVLLDETSRLVTAIVFLLKLPILALLVYCSSLLGFESLLAFLVGFSVALGFMLFPRVRATLKEGMDD